MFSQEGHKSAKIGISFVLRRFGDRYRRPGDTIPPVYRKPLVDNMGELA